MKEIELKGSARVSGKKADIKNLRRNGEIPCVLYGPGMEESILFSVNEREMTAITHTPNSYIINIDIDGKKHKAIFHQAQFHPVEDITLHVDFLAVSSERPVAIDIPIRIVGNSDGVKQGGKLMINARKLRVLGALDKLPDDLVVDITKLKLGKQISAGELVYDDIKIISPKSTIVCAVKMTRAAIGAAAAAAAAANK